VSFLAALTASPISGLRSSLAWVAESADLRSPSVARLPSFPSFSPILVLKRGASEGGEGPKGSLRLRVRGGPYKSHLLLFRCNSLTADDSKDALCSLRVKNGLLFTFTDSHKKEFLLPFH